VEREILVYKNIKTTAGHTGVYVSREKQNGCRLHLFHVGFLPNHQVIFNSFLLPSNLNG